MQSLHHLEIDITWSCMNLSSASPVHGYVSAQNASVGNVHDDDDDRLDFANFIYIVLCFYSPRLIIITSIVIDYVEQSHRY